MSQNPAHKVRTLIYGSCVSRDTFEYLDQGRFELTRYIARQSLISAFSAPTEIDATALQSLGSEFQKRTLADDMRGSLAEDLSKYGVDAELILWDTTDERFGVYEVRAGQYVTRSLELVASGSDAHYSARYPLIRYGSRKHLTLWTAATIRFAKLLASTAPRAKLVLIAPEWACRDTAGRATRSPINMSVRSANRITRRYVRKATSELNVQLVSLAGPIANAAHPWGPAPYHYDTGTYQRMARDVEHFD